MLPFDFAWAVLKAHDERDFPPTPSWSSSDQGYNPRKEQFKGGRVEEHIELPEDDTDFSDPGFDRPLPDVSEGEGSMAPEEAAPEAAALELLSGASPETVEALRRLLGGGGE